MTWPFARTAVISQRFGDPRARGAHKAWDVADKLGSPIVAPEDGELWLFHATRSHTGRIGDRPYESMGGQLREILPQALKAYSWYWADRVGCCAVLQAQERWWLFAHLDPSDWWTWFNSHGNHEYAERHGVGVPPAWKAEIHYRSRVVYEGNAFGAIGNGGVSTGPHCHMELTSPGYPGGASGRIDPATIWPDR